MRKLKNNELNRISAKEYKTSDKSPVILVLDNVRSLYNVGSVFRTADAFRIQAIYLCGITGKPPNPEINKSALGATDSVNWEYSETTQDAVLMLKQNNFNVFALEQTDKSIPLQNFTPQTTNNEQQSTKFAFIFGNEIKGVSDELLEIIDGSIEIPQFGTKHSFNIAVSVGILLWHYYINTLKKSDNL
jgi:23S rRNA (guanosine2251-2'-O)-methyltransferase